MRKKIFLLAVCMMLLTTAVVSAVKIMNNEIDENIDANQITSDSSSIQSPEISTNKDLEDEPPVAPALITERMSVPAAAFNNIISYIDDWQQTGHSIKGSTIFVAPVQFKDGSTVTRMSINYYDDLPVDGTVSLVRFDNVGNTYLMAQLDTLGNSGYGQSNTITINYADIDNYGYGYYLEFYSAQVTLLRVHFEFTYPDSSRTNNFGEVSQENMQTNPLSK